ncbi:MAG: DUF4349 domain-containing protein [Armatimonadetes bacterium]|nr:DUF4349 domain-containing protein [Armatimonadota bacterium]
MKTVQWLSLAAATLVIVGCAASEDTAGSYFGYDDDASARSANRMSASPSAAEDMGGESYGSPDISVITGAGRRASPAPRQALPGLTEMSTASMQQQRSVIRDGSISLRVEDVRITAREITNMVVKGGGYVESTNTDGVAGENPTVDMTIRVVSSGFDDAMMTLEDMGILLDQSSNARDVTAQIVDLGARVKTLTAKEDTFREMLRNARTTSDIIALQERLTQVRTEIERMEAQRKSLSQLASLSTITVHLTENATVPVVAKDPNWFGQTFASASSSFMGIGRGVVGMVTWIVVFSPFWLLPILAASWAWKRYGRRVPPTITQ